jgi:hypothetical protein
VAIQEKVSSLVNPQTHLESVIIRDIRTLLFGDSQKSQSQNILLTKAVQTFIKKSRRFTESHHIITIKSMKEYRGQYSINTRVCTAFVNKIFWDWLF